METHRVVSPGFVRNGLVVPRGDAPLSEGAQVEVVIHSPELTPELRTEFEAWERAGDEAWALVDEWERKERS